MWWESDKYRRDYQNYRRDSNLLSNCKSRNDYHKPLIKSLAIIQMGGVILGFELIYGRQLLLSPTAAFYHSHVQSCHHDMTVEVAKTQGDLQRQRRAVRECVRAHSRGFFFCEVVDHNTSHNV